MHMSSGGAARISLAETYANRCMGRASGARLVGGYAPIGIEIPSRECTTSILEHA
jgi:hypothetical protein